ncbi:MAG TPA: hypothetical protein VKT83_00505 [bacterium]|nr:hypothetical protein [bacterium]
MTEIPQAGGGPAVAGGPIGAAGTPDEAQRRQVIESPSYGAAFFNWIYLLAMRAWGHALLALILIAVFWPASWIVYGMYGKRIAWQSRRWRDFDDFLACQRAWTRAAVVWTMVIAALLLVGMILSLLVPHHSFRPSI